MIRLKYHLILHEPISTNINTQLASKNYNDEEGCGFELIEISNSKILAVFIEKKHIDELVSYPNGSIETVRRTIFSRIQFSITSIDNCKDVVRIVNSPLSIKRFILELSKIYEGFIFDSIILDPYRTYQSLISNQNIDRFEVPRVIASQIPFSKSSIAKIDLKAQNNALVELESKYDFTIIKLNKIFLNLRINSVNESAEISSSGSVVCSETVSKIFDQYVISLNV